MISPVECRFEILGLLVNRTQIPPHWGRNKLLETDGQMVKPIITSPNIEYSHNWSISLISCKAPDTVGMELFAENIYFDGIFLPSCLGL